MVADRASAEALSWVAIYVQNCPVEDVTWASAWQKESADFMKISQIEND